MYLKTLLFVLLFHTTIVAEELIPLRLDGIALETTPSTPPAVMVTENFILPADESFLQLPFVFTGDISTTNITAHFDGVELLIINVDTIDSDVVETLIIDVDDIKGLSGQLTLELSINGTTAANLFILTDINSPVNPGIILYLLN